MSESVSESVSQCAMDELIVCVRVYVCIYEEFNTGIGSGVYQMLDIVYYIKHNGTFIVVSFHLYFSRFFFIIIL